MLKLGKQLSYEILTKIKESALNKDKDALLFYNDQLHTVISCYKHSMPRKEYRRFELCAESFIEGTIKKRLYYKRFMKDGNKRYDELTDYFLSKK